MSFKAKNAYNAWVSKQTTSWISIILFTYISFLARKTFYKCRARIEFRILGKLKIGKDDWKVISSIQMHLSKQTLLCCIPENTTTIPFVRKVTNNNRTCVCFVKIKYVVQSTSRLPIRLHFLACVVVKMLRSRDVLRFFLKQLTLLSRTKVCKNRKQQGHFQTLKKGSKSKIVGNGFPKQE